MAVVKPFAKRGSITASFERTGKGSVTYMHRQYTKMETKFVGLPIKMNQLTSEPEQKWFNGLRQYFTPPPPPTCSDQR